MGIATQAEQYGFYISLIILIMGSIQLLRKAYYIQKYLREINPRMILMIVQSDKEVSLLFLQEFKAVPWRFARITLLFYAV